MPRALFLLEQTWGCLEAPEGLQGRWGPQFVLNNSLHCSNRVYNNTHV